MNPNDHDPQYLQNKVQFDLHFYFCHRGNENIYKFKKSTFAVKEDLDTGLKYMIKQEDELTKNHNETSKDLVTAMMPEMPENPLCPVRSFQMYLSKLHPKCDSLWQRPCKKEHCSDADIWYYNKTIGQNTIAGFMSNLSHAADLSCIYTNHSIRVSTTTFLKRNKFTDNQIMAITGHKSVNSLQLYQKVAP